MAARLLLETTRENGVSKTRVLRSRSLLAEPLLRHGCTLPTLHSARALLLYSPDRNRCVPRPSTALDILPPPFSAFKQRPRRLEVQSFRLCSPASVPFLRVLERTDQEGKST